MGTPTKRYDICAGKPYTNRDGEVKKQWIKCGKLTEWDEGGPSIEWLATPAGSWFDGKLSCFLQEPKDGAQASPPPRQSQPAKAPITDDFDDSLPDF